MTLQVFSRPRMRLLANGIAFPVITAEWSAHGYYGAGRFSAQLAASQDPAHGPAWWAGKATYDIDLQGGSLPPGAPEGAVSWQSAFTGSADDELSIDFDRGVIDLQGRDYSAKLIDAKTAETFSNQTLAQIAATLAGRVGLQASVGGSSQLAGQFYQIDHARTAHDTFSKSTSYWEIICYLAQQEGYDVWVDGKTLHVAPKDASASAAPVITVQTTQPKVTGGMTYGRTATVRGLTGTRRPALAKDVRVTVKSWAPKGKAMVSGSDGPASADQQVVRTFPNLTAAQCSALARSIRAELGRHERNVSFEMPGDFTLRPRQGVAVTGTGTAFDATFFISEISNHYDMKSGLWQTIRARSLPPSADQGSP